MKTEKLPEGWKRVKLGEVVIFENGKVRPKIEGNIPIYGGNGILGYCNKFNYNGEIIIIGRVGAYCGTVFFENRPIWISDNALSGKAKEANSTKYLYYLLKNLDLNKFALGSSHPLITQDLLNSIEVNITTNENEQKAIASVLSSIDDKIDLLHRQNQTLEKIAETLFRKWFIEPCKDELPEDWKEKRFSDFIEKTLSGDWGKESLENNYTKKVNCLRGTDLADLQVGIPSKTPIRFIEEKKFEKIKIMDGDIIIEISGGTENQSTGRVIYINDTNKKLFLYPLVFSNFCRLLRPIGNEFSYFLYLYFKYLYDNGEFFSIENGSSGIKNLDYKYLLNNFPIYVPNNENYLLDFNNVIKTYFEKINKNKLQIRTLENLRDTLLPKLISGEVRVKYD